MRRLLPEPHRPVKVKTKRTSPTSSSKPWAKQTPRSPKSRKSRRRPRQGQACANFADLAKQYSEDTTKDKGGDLGWIVRDRRSGFEAAAFSLPKGSISDLVKTQYGFHIIQVIDRQVARTQTFDEVKAAIHDQLAQEKSRQEAETVSAQIAEDIAAPATCPSMIWLRSTP